MIQKYRVFCYNKKKNKGVKQLKYKEKNIVNTSEKIKSDEIVVNDTIRMYKKRNIGMYKNGNIPCTKLYINNCL